MKRRKLAFALIAVATAFSLLAFGQQPKKAPPPKPAGAAVKKPPPKPPVEDADGSAPMAGKDERTEPVAKEKDAGKGGSVVEQKTLDGGSRVFRFGEVEVEGRLKSPQIVYFLRRVRAEFAAGDLGHRTFVRELSDTRNDPAF